MVTRHLPASLSVRPGDALAVTARHTACYLQNVTVSGYSADMLREPPPKELEHLIGNPQARGLTASLDAPVGRKRR